MSSENTSVLAFTDLITEVAYKLGVASYGVDGQSAPSIPTDTHDLTLCKRIVNKAIRMFIHDAPKTGWNWLSTIAQVDLWPTISEDTSNKVSSATFASGVTTITVPNDSFYPSMEMRTISFNGGTVSATIVSYVSARSVKVAGDLHTTALNQAWAMTATGDYTLPANFGGQYDGEITFVTGTNRGMFPHWTHEASIRSRRQNYNIETGTPYEFAVRQIPIPDLPTDYVLPRQRWELMTWRMPSEFLHVIFPFTMHFDTLVNLTDLSPAPFPHDETIKAACLAVAEKEVEDTTGGPDWTYYRDICLPNSYRVDANSKPKALGYFGNPSAAGGVYPAIKAFRDYWYQRPTVPVN